MTKIAEETTGKKGDEAIRDFQMMQSRTGVSYTKDGWTFKDSWGENGQLVNREAQRTTDKGLETINYDPQKNIVNRTLMNADKVDKSQTWDLSYNVKGAQESMIKENLANRNISDEQRRQIMFEKAAIDELSFSIDGAKKLANNLLAVGDGYYKSFENSVEKLFK